VTLGIDTSPFEARTELAYHDMRLPAEKRLFATPDGGGEVVSAQAVVRRTVGTAALGRKVEVQAWGCAARRDDATLRAALESARIPHGDHLRRPGGFTRAVMVTLVRCLGGDHQKRYAFELDPDTGLVLSWRYGHDSRASACFLLDDNEQQVIGELTDR
jgi:hypothetical protein